MAAYACKKLFSTELGQRLNWNGTDKKRGLKKMKIGECILGESLGLLVVLRIMLSSLFG